MTRTLLYSHDTYGLGHLRRCSLLASALVERDEDHDVVIVTGSPSAQAFALPDRVDTIKLPAATKDGAGAYRARSLRCDLSSLVQLRSELLMAAVATYEPDVVVVDHAPVGMAGELLPLLRRLACSRLRPRLVLGLRDIIDDAARVERSWAADGSWERLGVYDEIMVYGDPAVGTTAQDLQLERRVEVPVHHTGYVAPDMPEPSASDPFVLVTPGGGGDGMEMVQRHLHAVAAGALDGVRSLVVTGPLMSVDGRAELIARAAPLESVTLVEFVEDLRSLIAAATCVVSMAGYNTVAEELAAGTPALLVPRSRPRLEQDLRARRLEPHAAVERCPVDQLGPERLHHFVAGALDTREVTSTVDLSGRRRVAELITSAGRCAGHRPGHHGTTTRKDHSHV